MNFIKQVWRGKYSLTFTFWVMGFLVPMPILAGKVYLRDAGIFMHEDTVVYSAGQVFLWIEWFYFAFITVAIWNAATNYLGSEKEQTRKIVIWGRAGQVIAIASGLLALGSLSNLIGFTEAPLF